VKIEHIKEQESNLKTRTKVAKIKVKIKKEGKERIGLKL
jgi:hypothetical protein